MITSAARRQSVAAADGDDCSLARVRLKCREARCTSCLALTRRQLAVVCAESVPLHNVRHLYVSGCGLSADDLLSIAGALRHQLVTLDASDNRIDALPAGACEALADCLEVLDCSRNNLSRLTPAVASLSRLRELNIAYNRLVYVPSEVGQLATLRALDASHNCVVGLPDGLFLGAAAARLEVLRLAGNRLATLPDSLGALSRLRELDVSCNALRRLPASVRRLGALEALHAQGNPWSPLPPQPQAAAAAVVRLRVEFASGRAGGVGELSFFGVDARAAVAALAL